MDKEGFESGEELNKPQTTSKGSGMMAEMKVPVRINTDLADKDLNANAPQEINANFPATLPQLSMPDLSSMTAMSSQALYQAFAANLATLQAMGLSQTPMLIPQAVPAVTASLPNDQAMQNPVAISSPVPQVNMEPQETNTSSSQKRQTPDGVTDTPPAKQAKFNNVFVERKHVKEKPSSVIVPIERDFPVAMNELKEEKATFKCKFCPRIFIEECRKFIHEKTHPTEKPYLCTSQQIKSVATKKSVSENGVPMNVEHASIESPSESSCKSPFTPTPASVVPLQINTNKDQHTEAIGKPYNCLLCNQGFTNEVDAQQHMLETHTPELLKSSPAVFSVKSNINVNQGSLMTTQATPLENALFSEPEQLSHGTEQQIPRTPEGASKSPGQEKLSPTLNYTCHTCQKIFPDASQLMSHVQRAHAGTTIICPLCEETFTSAAQLRNHIKHKHVEHRPFSCEVCSKAFKQRATLKQHIKLHLNEKPYVCNICSRGFVYPSRLKTHQQTCKILQQNQADNVKIDSTQSFAHDSASKPPSNTTV